MFKLDHSIIDANLSTILCEYSCEDSSSIIARSSFTPESFRIAEKRKGRLLLFFNNTPYDTWINNMIWDQLNVLTIKESEKRDLLNQSFDNINTLLQFKYNGIPLEEQIINQEFVDILRNVIYFTVYGAFGDHIDTAGQFNTLASKILPSVISLLEMSKPSLKELFLFSVASGRSGLDLKGAPAAASAYANEGIPMKQYLSMDSSIAASDYYSCLRQLIAEARTPIFHWNEFIDAIQQSKKIVWFTDDYIESHFDLLFIHKLLETYTNLAIEIIPKNGRYGNDLSYDDSLNLIQGLFAPKLLKYYDSGRLTVSPYGPKMGAANIRKLSNSCARDISKADIVMIKGCRMHEMLQGGLNAHSFSAFIVCRELSEITTGLNSREYPITLVHLSPGEYAFWGTEPSLSQQIRFNGRTINACTSTLVDHERRKAIVDPQKIVYEIELIQKLIPYYSGNKDPLYKEIDLLENKIHENKP